MGPACGMHSVKGNARDETESENHVVQRIQVDCQNTWAANINVTQKGQHKCEINRCFSIDIWGAT